MSATHIPAHIRRLVSERAAGRCEYCQVFDTLVLAAHEIDHIVAEKHGGLTEANNLALACALCNKRKGSDLASLDPDTGELTPLYHPRQHNWAEHFRWDGARITALTPIGRATVRLLQLNSPTRLAEREWLSAAGLLS